MAEKNEIKKEKTNRSFSGLRGIFSRMQQRMQQNKMLRQDKVLSDLNKQLRNIKGIYLPTEEDKMNFAQLTETIRNRENELIGEISAEPIRGIVEDVPVSNTRSDVVFGNKNMPDTTMPSIEEITVSAQPRMPSLEEITVSAEKRPMPPQKPAFNVASKLGRNQLKSLQKRAARMRENPDAYVRNPDYAIEFLPDYLQEKYRDELMQLAGQYAGGGLMDIKQQTQNVAAQGRYGDSMLMHVNPAEVHGLSQVMPLTVNPDTGQPEAFLPFLAPLLGSVFGPTLFGAMGATGALTGLAGSALGSGLAQWAATGDFKKGLLAGVTGYGVGSALQGAEAAAGAGAGEIAETTMAGANPLTTSLPDISSSSNQLQNIFSGGAKEGLGHLATGLTDPLAMTAMYGGMAPTAMMESEEAYAAQMQRMQEEEEESRRQNWLNTPEPILYSAGGGSTNMDPSVQADIAALSMMAGGGRTGYSNGGPMGMPNFNNFSGDQQRFTPARQTYAVNPDFLAGFAPETMYFQPNTLNQPATATTTGGAPVLEDTYEGSKGGFGGVQATIAPTTTINPYEEFTGSAPAGLEFVQPEVAPIPDVPVDTPPPVTPPVTPPTTPPTTPPIFPPDFPINWDDILGDIDLPSINWDDYGIDYPFNFDPNNPTMPNIDMPDPNIENPVGEPHLGTPPIGMPDFPIDEIPEDFLGIDPGWAEQPTFDPTNPNVGFNPPSIDMPNIDMPTFDNAIKDDYGLDFYKDQPNLPVNFDPNIMTPTVPQGPKMPMPDMPMPVDLNLDMPTFDPVGQPAPAAPPVLATPPEMITSPSMQPESPMLPMPMPDMETPMPDKGFPTLEDMNRSKQEDMRRLELEKPPLTNTELKEKILSGELPMSMVPKPNMQPELPVGIAPPNTAPPKIVPQGDDGRVLVGTGGRGGKGTRMGTQMPNGTVILDGGLQAIMPDGNVIDLGKPKRNEISIEEEMVTPPKPEPKKKPTRNKRGGRGGRAVGGSTDSESMLIEIVQKDPLASEVVQFILGNSDNQEVIPAFVEKYGNELFLQLREAVLQELAPDAQTEGLIQGVGNGGMDDDINGTIGDKEKIAVSQDEFIIPADVVSMLGDGSSQAGSEELYNMMDRVRQAKTGTAEQAPRLANKGGFLPA